MNEQTDAVLYRKLSEPFPSPEAANEALEKFQDELLALREKHHIPDLLTVICVNITYPTGEGRAMLPVFNGNDTLSSAMAAYAYGHYQAADREFLNSLLAWKRNQPNLKGNTYGK